MNGVLKIILTSISLFVAACGILVARRVFIPNPVMSGSIENIPLAIFSRLEPDLHFCAHRSAESALNLV